MTRHEPFLLLAAAAVDFELASDERRRLDEHLALCPVCRRSAVAFATDAAAIVALPRPALAPARADEVLARLLTPPRGLTPLRLVLVAAAVALLAVASVVVGTELLRRADQQQDPVSVLPTPVASSDPSASPEPASPVPVAWTRAEMPADAWPLGTVVAGPDGFVAVGGISCEDWSEPSGCYLSVATSADGTAWEAISRQDALVTEPYFPTSGPTLGLRDVAWGSEGWVAVGYVADPTPAGEPLDVHVATWTSADGTTWVRSKPEDDAVFEGMEPKSIAAGPDGYVVVGTDHSESTDLAIGTAWAAALTSSDGKVWTRTGLDPALDAGGFCDTTEWPSYGGMDAVEAVPGVGYLAVGTITSTGSAVDVTCDAASAAWRSSDGLAWQRVATFPEIAGGSVDLAVDGEEVVASLSCSEPGCAELAMSSDLATWMTIPGPRDIGVSTIGMVDGTIVVAGPAEAMGPDTSAAPVRRLTGVNRSDPPQSNWEAVEGIDWTGIGYPNALDLAVSEDRVVLLGYSEEAFAFVRR